MSDSNSVTHWIEDLKQGNEDAAARLWERYFGRMVEAAQQKLGGHQWGAADAEDVALSAFDSLCRGAAKGNFTQLNDRYDLWPLLLTITAQKSVDRLRWERRQRRGGGDVRREADFTGPDHDASLDEILSRSPTPEVLAQMDEELSRLLGLLRDDTLRDIVRWKLEGNTNAWIAEFLGVSVHTIGRKLRVIRLTWSQELNASTR
jgi:DNA-directed RNA polymerase specialized sigma24 family protein